MKYLLGRTLALSSLAAISLIAHSTSAEPVRKLWHYQSSVSSDGDGPLDLTAELNYDDERTGAPIAVVMHQYSGSKVFGQVRPHAQRLRDLGFFSISVAMRGREGSDGTRDSGGLEIHDIYDAVESIKDAFADQVDPTNIHITGYSGGGGNALSALTKFPDYFRLGSSFFGISDYGHDRRSGWYYLGAGSRIKQLNEDIGDPRRGDPAVLDRYHARASNLAAQNNPYSEIHLFVNHDEPICPPVNAASYRDRAVAAEAHSGEFDNIHVHVGRQNTYEDFNGNGRQDPDEHQWWPHHSPTPEEQAAGENWYIARLLDGSIPEPKLKRADELFVPGFVKTKPFWIWLGNGDNAAGTLKYELTDSAMTFELDIASRNKNVVGALTADLSTISAEQVEVLLNGRRLEVVPARGTHRVEPVRHGEKLIFRAVAE